MDRSRHAIRAFASIVFCLALIALCLPVYGCFTDTVKLVNVQTFDVSDVRYVSLAYGTDNITVLPSTSDELVVKEYCSKEDSRYYASVFQSSDAVVVKTGERPDDATFSSYVELYLPSGYDGTLAITTGSGVISIRPDCSLKSLRAISSSGSITIGDIEARSISARSGSGGISIGSAHGTLDCLTETGTISVDELVGDGSFTSRSGSVTVGIKRMDGLMTATTTTGRIRVDVPKDAALMLDARSDDGVVKVPFSDEDISDGSDDHHVGASVGDNPERRLVLESVTGSVTVGYL